MDQATLVREQLDEGAEIVKTLRDESFGVSDAYWHYTGEYDRWSLCLVVPDLDDRGIRRSYKKVQTVVAGRPATLFGVDPFDVKLVDLSDPVARAIDAFQSKHGDALPTNVRGTTIEGQYIERAFIYPRSMNLR